MSSANPGPFSLNFHTKYFPRLFLRRLFAPAPPVRSGVFTSHLPMEFTLLPIGLVIAALLILPPVFARSAGLGWILVALASALTAALTMKFMKPDLGQLLEWENFNPYVFLTALTAGLTGGVVAGLVIDSREATLAGMVLGLMAGYFFGIFCGLWVQAVSFWLPMIRLVMWVALPFMLAIDSLSIYLMFFRKL